MGTNQSYGIWLYHRRSSLTTVQFIEQQEKLYLRLYIRRHQGKPLILVKLPEGHGFSVATKNMAENWQSMTEEVREKIEKSNANCKAAADKHRRKQLFAVGDQVLVFL